MNPTRQSSKGTTQHGNVPEPVKTQKDREVKPAPFPMKIGGKK